MVHPQGFNLRQDSASPATTLHPNARDHAGLPTPGHAEAPQSQPSADLQAELTYLRAQNQSLQTQLKQNVAELENQREHLLDSIRYAQRIQQALLPINARIKSWFPQFASWYSPKDILSGDFYWFHADPANQRCLLAVCDCTGHGVPGAFMSVLGYSLLNEAVERYRVYRPNQVLAVADSLMRQVLASVEGLGRTRIQDGMDCSLVLLDFGRGVVEFAGANNPLYLLRGGRVRVYKGDKQSIGGDSQADKSFTNTVLAPQAGDRLVLFSDGVVDQFGGPRNRKFTPRRMRNCLEQGAGLPLANQLNNLQGQLQDWMKGSDQTDDICVLGLELPAALVEGKARQVRRRTFFARPKPAHTPYTRF